MLVPIRLLLLLLQHFLLLAACGPALGSSSSSNNNNWAVIVSSSRYWHNYRHGSNALALYQEVKRLGIPDSNIILMVADVPACNPRNLHPGTVYRDPGAGTRSNLFVEGSQVDYRGREVNVESLLQVLTGRHHRATPLSKRLRSNTQSNVLLYLTGHGGDEFLKFHDYEELLAQDLANALTQMHLAGRYRELLLIVDTCQAATLFNRITAPSITGLATSKLGESSYAHYVDLEIGLHLSDQFAFHLASFLAPLVPNSTATVQQAADYAKAKGMASTIVPWRSTQGGRGLREVGLMEFFSGGAMEATYGGVSGATVALGAGAGAGVGDSNTSGGGEAQHAQREQLAQHANQTQQEQVSGWGEGQQQVVGDFGGAGGGHLCQNPKSGQHGQQGQQAQQGPECPQQQLRSAAGAQLYSMLLDAPSL